LGPLLPSVLQAASAVDSSPTSASRTKDERHDAPVLDDVEGKSVEFRRWVIAIPVVALRG